MQPQIGGSSYENSVLIFDEDRAQTRVGRSAILRVFVWAIVLVGMMIFIFVISPGLLQFIFLAIIIAAFLSLVGRHETIEFNLKTAEIRVYQPQPIILVKGEGKVRKLWPLSQLQHLELDDRRSVNEANMGHFKTATLTMIFEDGSRQVILNHTQLDRVERSAHDLAAFLDCELQDVRSHSY